MPEQTPKNQYGILREPALIDPPYPGPGMLRVHPGSPVYLVATWRTNYACEFLISGELVAGVLPQDSIQPLETRLATPDLRGPDPLTQILDTAAGAIVRDSLTRLCREHPCTYDWIDEKEQEKKE